MISRWVVRRTIVFFILEIFLELQNSTMTMMIVYKIPWNINIVTDETSNSFINYNPPPEENGSK